MHVLVRRCCTSERIPHINADDGLGAFALLELGPLSFLVLVSYDIVQQCQPLFTGARVRPAVIYCASML